MQNILTRNFINHFTLKTLTPQFSNLLPFLSYKFFIFRERLNNVDVSVNPNDAIVCVTGFLVEAKWDMWAKARETKFHSRRWFVCYDWLVWLLGNSSKDQQELFGNISEFIYNVTTIHPTGIQTRVYLGKGVRYMHVFRQHYPDMTLRQMPVGGWYKSLTDFALRRHTWQDSRSSLSTQTSYHQLNFKVPLTPLIILYCCFRISEQFYTFNKLHKELTHS